MALVVSSMALRRLTNVGSKWIWALCNTVLSTPSISRKMIGRGVLRDDVGDVSLDVPSSFFGFGVVCILTIIG